jgi:hypothetical protein
VNTRLRRRLRCDMNEELHDLAERRAVLVLT